MNNSIVIGDKKYPLTLKGVTEAKQALEKIIAMMTSDTYATSIARYHEPVTYNEWVTFAKEVGDPPVRFSVLWNGLINITQECSGSAVEGRMNPDLQAGDLAAATSPEYLAKFNYYGPGTGGKTLRVFLRFLMERLHMEPGYTPPGWQRK